MLEHKTVFGVSTRHTKEATRMFLFWTVSLMFALQRVSSDEKVSLSCNQTVEVTTGGAVTLQCSVMWSGPIAKCGNISFTWNTNQSNLCRSNVCTEENATLIRMEMRSVWEEQTVTVGVLSGCGMDSSTIRVKLVEDEITFNKSSSTTENLTVLKVLPVAAAAACSALYEEKTLKKPEAGERGPGGTTNRRTATGIQEYSFCRGQRRKAAGVKHRWTRLQSLRTFRSCRTPGGEALTSRGRRFGRTGFLIQTGLFRMTLFDLQLKTAVNN
ncbi:uncharacterized protein LOC101170245 isoform X2 [Oryzias latipes]|uniref:uncharacterized protein LOC101170245 isoform X2 n=1 Tax=Oryzias latipes TaxID=8090 RepID=UPI0009D9551B|nr:uncharacterized protein LOC101170245 isoform X2 [Oryzias latipes]XP_023805345.1 uncharacterized protein LOC101170245 isoform X2 [Oryzias latipes]